MQDAPAIEIERAKQVFRFLKAFAERKLPVRRRLDEQLWQLPLRDLPKHPSIEIGRVILAGAGTVAGDEPAGDDAPLLRVRRPKITQPPALPQLLKEWIQSGWEQPQGSIQVMPSRTFERDGEAVTEELTADPARAAALEQWQAAWQAWAQAELPARKAMKVFERLYELRGRIERESESVELLLGDGRLRWRMDEGAIDHPVLLQRVELTFDAAVPEFTVVDADRPPELYGILLQAGDGLAATKLNELRVELERGGYHPLAGPETNAYLARLASLLHAQGTFLDVHVEQAATSEPVVMRDPVLFLRTRLSGFPAAFERILIELERASALPASLTRLVGVEPRVWDDTIAPSASPWGEPADVLLSKPANQEQVQIARALERHRAVLVQGPPGTGKSHTIANLIGHLVAQGKRVLVTSHTTKALRVLRGQIVESLQPLAVAVLDKDLESRTQMEGAVRGILARLTVSTEDALEREASVIREKRQRLNGDIDRLTDGLREARAAEYLPIRLAGEDLEPAAATRWVREHQVGNDWIPGPAEAAAPLPLAPEEARRLYELNGLLTPAEEAEIDARLPDLAALPDVPGFRAWVKTPRVEERPATARIWRAQHATEDAILLLGQFKGTLTAFGVDLDALSEWQKHLVVAGHTGGAEWKLWESLEREVVDAHRRWESHRGLLVECEVTGELADGCEAGRSVCAEILRYLEGGSTVGRLQLILHSRWRALVSAMRVDGHRPATPKHFRAIAAHFEILESRASLERRWRRQAEAVGLPAFRNFGGQPEPALLSLVGGFAALGSWWRDRWAGIVRHATDAGLDLDSLRQVHATAAGTVLPFERDQDFVRKTVAAAVDVKLAVVQSLCATRRLGELEALLSNHEGEVITRLRASVSDRDAAGYDLALAELKRLTAKQDIWQERRKLTARLAVTAPGWADALRARAGVHGCTQSPGDPATAWRWRQLHQEIDRRAALNESELLRRLEQRRRELRDATADLIDRQAWLAQLKRTDLRARQALQGWADTVRKIGKGTGKRTAELQSRARQLLTEARDAVPVWIMPLGRVAESFDPSAGRFDVVIVDEASQSDIQGLLAWYLGDRIAIVGDHEQVSPMAVGQEIDAIRGLIAEHLHGVPNQHLYDGKTSVYDLGRQCFGGTIALREHFRCVPDIIEFSNALSYDYEIRPLRNPGTAARPHVAEFVATPALGYGRSGKANEAEVRATVAIMSAAFEMPEYAGKTFGAITLLGDEQAQRIHQLALETIGAVALEHRRFVAGNSAQFQGDERDVMFLSMVDSPTGSVLRIVASPEMKQRYNVAASRARDQLWLVHSLDPGRDLQAGDLRRRLIDHVRDPGARRRDEEAKGRRTESPFELAVLKRMIAADYDVQPQVWVGRYRIDFVVRSGANEVAVECDGDRYHGHEQIADDMSRQAILERAGWRFVRIRGTRFFRDPDAIMRDVFERLGEMGIHPGKTSKSAGPDPAESELRERVVRRAWEIMRERKWLGAEATPESRALLQ